MTIQLRPYQIDGLNALWNYFASGNKGNPCLAWPTGVGKSLVPAMFIEHVLRNHPHERFLMVTHVSTLIQQNYEVLKEVWRNAPVGIYSAGLKRKETAFPIVYGGIQSMIKQPHLFGKRDIIFIDEAHLISNEESSQYLTFLSHMKLANPNLRIVGMTATPYRMGSGMITDEGGIFTDICHDLCSMDSFNKLVAEGYMCPLIPFPTKTELDVTGVKTQQGEFVATQLQGAVDKAEITYKALQEAISVGYNRKSWLIFASGIEHAEHIAEQLGAFGIDCAPVHSKRDDKYNDAAIKAFKANELRAIVNYGKLTTGFNHPGIDLILMLRPTMSVPLWVQMLGRGTRPAEGKTNCMVLDFAKNTPRLGPINDPRIPNKKGNAEGEMPIKICESCGAYNHPKVRFCANCNAEFSFEIKITSHAGSMELLKNYEAPIVETFNVTYAIYAKHDSKSGKPTLKASYFCGSQLFHEFVCLEHGGYAKKIAHDWWRKRSKLEPPSTVEEGLKEVSNLRCPRFVRVHVNKKPYTEILGVEF